MHAPFYTTPFEHIPSAEFSCRCCHFTVGLGGASCSSLLTRSLRAAATVRVRRRRELLPTAVPTNPSFPLLAGRRGRRTRLLHSLVVCRVHGEHKLVQADQCLRFFGLENCQRAEAACTGVCKCLGWSLATMNVSLSVLCSTCPYVW